MVDDQVVFDSAFVRVSVTGMFRFWPLFHLFVVFLEQSTAQA